MVAFDAGETLADRFRAHMGHSESLYGHAMRGMADDWEAGGVVREICRGWEDAPAGAVVQLRLLAGVFREVLLGKAPELVRYYPCLGGTAEPDGVWPGMREVMERSVPALRAALSVAPQTNEVGRSCALVVGLFEAVRRSGLSRVRLLEPGASAGLNLLVDRFRFQGDGWALGPRDSPLVLRPGAAGVLPEPFTVVARRGCDLEPVDSTTDEGALRLRSFVWPWQLERHDRLAAALAVGCRHPVVVDRAPAGEWLEAQLAAAPEEGVLTVVWQAVTRMYWPAEESARVAHVVDEAAARMPVAHVAMEYGTFRGAEQALLTLDGGLLAAVGDHGPPVTLARTG